MHPDRVARLLAVLGIYLLLAVLAVRVVSLVNIAWRVNMGVLETPLEPAIPSLGHYSMSLDGRQVTFEKQVETNGDTQWFSMPLVGGPANPTERPETSLKPFLVRDNKLYLPSGDGYLPVQASPRDTRLGNYARSPDGSALAFSASTNRLNSTLWGLYIVSDTGQVDWLGDQERIGEISWSADGQYLAFVAITNGAPQVFVARRDGQAQRQLTNSAALKSRLHWSPDGRMIAYMETTGRPLTNSTPTPSGPPPHGPYQPTEPPPVNPKYAIAVVDVGEEDLAADTGGSIPVSTNPAALKDNSAPVEFKEARTFLQDDQLKLDLSWGMEDAGPVVVYALALPERPQTSYLYALDPHTGSTRRIYPPQEITALECPAAIPGNGSGMLRITITNTSLRPAEVQMLLRARPQRFPPAGRLNTNIARSENVAVAADAAQTVEWPVGAQSGLVTHIAVLANPNTAFAMDEKRCVIRNTYDSGLSFLPNLPYLSMATPLSLAGFLLCIPWLRKKKKRWLWILYTALPVLIFAIILVETYLTRTRLS